ncbi:uncharacterized protein LOC133903194 [Phragmites australis]|uniref:uncharacterized protein LOC133903194 n=1 Tax=Phragmites australis TaxID=29695 RepID=UPI002D775293|nr:uncharacterized protein LOC133903194 [Phragmites australis]
MTDNFIVKRMLRAITSRNVTLVTLIRERQDFNDLTSHDVLRIILAHDLMQQESKEVYDLTNQGSSSKKQDLTLKAKREVESSTSEDESEDHQGKDDMALFVRIINKFLNKSGYNKDSRRKAFKKLKGRYSLRRCYECDELGHFITDCPNKKDKKDNEKKDKHHKKDKSKYHKKNYKGQAHIGQEWDSNNSDTDSDEDEGVATIAFATTPPTKSLFDHSSDDEAPVCLMAKGRKVSSTTKSLNIDVTSEHGSSSDSDDDLLDDLSKISLPIICELLETI